jgi:hypothetical protein
MLEAVPAYLVTEHIVNFEGILFCGNSRFAVVPPRRMEIGFSAPASCAIIGPVIIPVELLACLLFPL